MYWLTMMICGRCDSGAVWAGKEQTFSSKERPRKWFETEDLRSLQTGRMSSRCSRCTLITGGRIHPVLIPVMVLRSVFTCPMTSIFVFTTCGTNVPFHHSVCTFRFSQPMELSLNLKVSAVVIAVFFLMFDKYLLLKLIFIWCLCLVWYYDHHNKE